MKTLLESFPPIASSSARILILGSMPGKKSLEMQQYYAHPQNLFWLFMAELLRFDKKLDYPERTAKLVENHIALWDVLRHCHRKGSMDHAIQKDSIIPNDFAAFLKSHKHITTIFFNGKKAEEVFNKQVKPEISRLFPMLHYVGLPSTSPANAAISKADKLKRWRKISETLK